MRYTCIFCFGSMYVCMYVLTRPDTFVFHIVIQIEWAQKPRATVTQDRFQQVAATLK